MRSAAIFLISVFSSGFLAISPVSVQVELGAELGIRFGPPDRSWIIGAAYEAFELSEQRIDITSKPVVFVRARYRIPL